MTDMTASGHLAYYTQHGINPVRYEMGDLSRHFQRRGSLYRTLGVTGLAIRGSRVLEVAPGTGQNSLYVASLGPSELTLVEPNPVAVRDITALYGTHGMSMTQPRLVNTTLQKFEPVGTYDVVICENWLGNSIEERGLLWKLAQMVAVTGLLVVTTVSPVGILPNVLRKALTCRLDDPAAPFAERTAVLSQAFGPHLETIPGMTRSVTDWVQDNVMNPAYFGIRLTIPMVLEDVGRGFDALGSSPRFGSDWRWFKSLAGSGREFNKHFLGEYENGLHNFLDYRKVLPPRNGIQNRALDAAAWEVSERVRELELDFYKGHPIKPHVVATANAVRSFLSRLSDLPGEWTEALNEFLDVFEAPSLTADRVSRMQRFGGLFGRETIYISLERTR